MLEWYVVLIELRINDVAKVLRGGIIGRAMHGRKCLSSSIELGSRR
jgi:hypothetical protein